MNGGEYGKLYKRAWGDPDFKALTEGQQALYHKLVSQPDVSLAGVLTYAPMRWAGQTHGLTVAQIEERFETLVARRFLLWDRDTQEVLIRSYIRNDGGWKSPRTMVGIASAVRRVLSDPLKGAVANELKRLEVDELPDTISPKTGRSTRQVVEPLIADLIVDFDGLHTPSDTPSDTPCDTPSDGVSDSWKRFAHATATATAPANAPAPAPANAKAAWHETSPRQHAEVMP